MSSFDGPTKSRLAEIRVLVRQLLPRAEERISYNIPAYFMNDKLVLYFAGFKNHVSVYPGRTNSAAYNKLAEKYVYGKSTARFANSEPLPKGIIREFVQSRLVEAGIHGSNTK
jgi:uncharacterized protein YdhG (YjbR/CyaY superfamily)